MEMPRTPEADILVEKVQKLFSAMDQAQREVHDGLAFLSDEERERVASQLKSTLQVGLVTRLCHMTLGGMGMDDEQVNAIGLDLLEELNKLGRDLLKADKAARKGH